MNYTDRLKSAGLKVTTPRLYVLTILSQSHKHHLSAENIYMTLKEAGHSIGLATVYRVLTQFEATGIIMRHHFEGGQSVFELARETHHDHLVCTDCASIEEFVDTCIEERQHTIALQAGFKMTGHQLNIYGLCTHCQNRLAAS